MKKWEEGRIGKRKKVGLDHKETTYRLITKKGGKWQRLGNREGRTSLEMDGERANGLHGYPGRQGKRGGKRV